METDRRNDLSERRLNYAVRIIRLVEALPNNLMGKRIGDQLLRSGTSPGANLKRHKAQSHTLISFTNCKSL
jgi:four helix bundle protein